MNPLETIRNLTTTAIDAFDLSTAHRRMGLVDVLNAE